ncbi:MAG TPA: DnaJ C-terminal domain-containing protein [Rubrivivax sp.]|nr:DnaJ C-terminal domain-containing protein [Rubrivivax sp.]
MEQDIDDAFAELGLTPDATELEFKAAWRRLVSQWHPDRNDSAAAHAKMQRINRAVEAIRQAGFRASEPAAGTAGAKPARSKGPRRRGGSERNDPPAGDAGQARPSQPADSEAAARTIHRRVRLTLAEAAFGCTKELRGKFTQPCAACAAAGYRVLGGHCPKCRGSGAIRQRPWFGWIGTQTECDACHGGGIARQPCTACAGSGTSSQPYKVTVRFPHGVRDGDLLGVDGGRGSPGSPPADLSIRIDVAAHELLELDQDGTVRCDMPVDGFAWIANWPVEVPTLGGPQTIQLQREQLSYRLSGQGFPVARRGPRGDQVVTITPVFPQRMSADQQILLDQLIATTSGPDAKPSDERLREWQQGLRAWKAGARGRR